MTHERHSHDKIEQSSLCLTAGCDIAHSKGVEKASVESDRWMRSILAASPVGIVHTRNRRIVWANTAWETMFGFCDDQEYVGQPTGIMHSSEIAYENVRSRLYDNVQMGEVSEADAVLRRNDGSIFDAHIRISLLDPKDPTIGTISSITDISERKAIEVALRESEERYHFLVDNVRDGIAVGQDGTIRFINQAVLEMGGYEAAELVDKPLSEFIHPDDRDIVLQYHFRRQKGEELPGRHSFRIVRKDGSIRWVEVNASMVCWEARPAVLSSLTDITERKKIEEALKESEEKYRYLVENANDIIYALDTKGCVKHVNTAALRNIGYTEEEVIGKFYLDFIPPHHRDSLKEFYLTQLVNKTPHT